MREGRGTFIIFSNSSFSCMRQDLKSNGIDLMEMKRETFIIILERKVGEGLGESWEWMRI